MQELLHHALSSPHTFGLLAGRGNTIEAILPVMENMLTEPESICKNIELQLAQLEINSLMLMGVYQATDNDGKVNSGQTNQLSSYVEKYSGNAACFHLLLELGTEGRLDALMFADAEHNIPIPLDMQEI
jgi:hypothetical protein